MIEIIKPFPQRSVISELLKGKTFTRALFNASISDYKIFGQVLDLGAKNTSSGYHTRIRNDEASVTFVDLQGGPGVVQMDVEKDFPFEDNQFDFVISVHLFEHVRHFQNSASEINRVLKKDGTFILCLPFFYPYHPDPRDYFRFTLDAITATWCDQTNLDCIQAEFLGPGPITNQIMPLFDVVKNRLAAILLKIPAYVFLSLLDFLVFQSAKKKGNHRVTKRYAIEHLVVMKKDG